MFKTFNIYNGQSEIIDHVTARTADEALDLFASIVSGYATFADMLRSKIFSAKFGDHSAA